MKKTSIPIDEMLAKARLARDAAVDICDRVEAFAKIPGVARYSPVVMKLVDLFERSCDGMHNSQPEVKRVLGKLTASIETGIEQAADLKDVVAAKAKKKG